MEQAFQKAVREYGSLNVNIAHYMPFGPPNVGKTCLLNRLVGKSPPGEPATSEESCLNSHSTIALEERKPVQVTISTQQDLKPVIAENCNWYEVEGVKEEIAILAKTLTERPEALHSRFQPNTSPIEEETSLTVGNNDTLQVSGLVQNGAKDRDMNDVQELLDHSMTLYCTDTGGQPEFQEVLPALIAGPVIFFFIFNLFKGLDSTYDVTFVTPSKKSQAYRSSFSVKQVLMQFLTSIAGYYSAISISCGISIPPPCVILVGTHWDLISDEELKSIEEELQKVCKRFESLTQMSIFEFNDDNHIIIPIDNYSNTDKNIKTVRTVVERIVKRDYSIPVPVPWLALQLHLRDLPEPTINYEACQEIARGYNIQSDEEFQQCLIFLHHRTGTIRYYPDVKELKKTIIIKPSIIFNAVTELITSTFTLEHVRHNPKNNFNNYGIFKTSSVKSVFDNHNPKLDIPFQAFLALLQHLYIISPSYNITLGDYFLPCALVHAPESDAVSTSVDPLLLIFDCGFVPKGIFSSLLAFLSQKKWNIEHLPDGKPCLYRNEASFIEEECGVNVMLKVKSDCLQVFIKDVKPSPDASLYKIRQILEIGILEICRRLNYNKEFSQFGFYCNNQLCKVRGKHFAKVLDHEDCIPKIKCDVTQRLYVMESEREIWFKAGLKATAIPISGI